jgi:hypothetical protein
MCVYQLGHGHDLASVVRRSTLLCGECIYDFCGKTKLVTCIAVTTILFCTVNMGVLVNKEFTITFS